MKFTDCYLGTRPIKAATDANITVDTAAKNITFTCDGPDFDTLTNLKRNGPPPLPQYPLSAKSAKKSKAVDYP